MKRRNPGGMSRTVTLGEFEDLKEWMSERFATKDDLKQFATKDDLKQFATKDDLKQFATKDDLKQFATKDWIGERFATKEETKGQFAVFEDKMLTGFDKVWGAIETLRQEVSLIHAAVLRIEGR